MSKCAHNFQMSAYLQDRVCFVGQNHVYEEGSDCLKELLGIDVSAKQIERVCHCYGELLENACAEASQERQEVQENEIVYVMADGSMVLTRKGGWKEIKLGRVFQANSHQAVSDKRHRISTSSYCAYLGHYKPFLEKLENQLPNGAQLVFLADGAKWFWEWIKSKYPCSYQILDYYHCKGYLYEFANGYFASKELKEKWIKKQQKRLFKDQVDRVIKEIKELSLKKAADSALKNKLLTYLENNKERMYYGTYRRKGLLIGSGPIEAAHRNVIQQRMKLAGQRWTIQGAQYIANLRVCRKSLQWDKIVEFSQNTKMAA